MTTLRRYTFPINPEFNKASVCVPALLPAAAPASAIPSDTLILPLFLVQLPWLLDQLQA